MTKLDEGQRCGWCRRPLPEAAAMGRHRAYCRQSCRQRAYEARQHAAEIGLSEGELVVTKQSLEELLDKVYVLQAAAEDVERDLEGSHDDPAELNRALQWLLSAAGPVVATRLL